MNRFERKAHAMQFAQTIADEWKSGKAKITDLMVTWKIGNRAVAEIIQTKILPDEYAKITRKHREDNCFSKGKPFKKGHVPWMKGKHIATRTCPVGTIRTWIVYHDACDRKTMRRVKRRFIKTGEGYRQNRRNWTAYSTYRWEQIHGPVPPGHFLRCIDRNYMNDEPSNWELVSRAQNIVEMEQRCRKRRIRASTRSIREKWVKHRTQKEREKAIPTRLIWECTECGADVSPGAKRCPKCGSTAIESNQVAIVPEYEDPDTAEEEVAWASENRRVGV